ncbi:glutamine-hydrolyzing carbamoyl-phosphate synthase small subunit [Pigmentiphaga litoralis]|uniref:Carbamoyl phosphate synthase small chain n=1 Tax=Pigmentiphaga litoralis TaxID=516702 RepID=A0A7Y9IZB4_9BURK|nr:glutamine-hydrolyzing carbamoyl-phosphate synthase small subunit [Pigmentiphaga litoralis]NYE26673.1 carbamoyl-phosphate synthase small subunit [Pigmentiphaga litoralis]NYE85917.1 carbamoyl-phosphate synthase small subunit [Pigmentiphaga litoralis]
MLPSLFPETTPAILALADGTIFRGISIGAPGHTVGEVVFNTAITGYQEIVTDPSYSRQIVTLTYPHIGNTGVTSEDDEASRIHAAGLVVRDYSLMVSNFRSERSLGDYLKDQNVVGIAGIDTRKLTRILREKGAQSGCILVGDDADEALRLAREFPGMAGMDLAKVVTVKDSYTWSDSVWKLGEGHGTPEPGKFHVVAMDFGVKRNILRLLVEHGCRVTVVPAQTSAADVLALNPDGLFLANGPGDPEPCDYAVAVTKEFLERQKPVFGICLGHQILGLAVGANTLKMKFGHHGANHPVHDVISGRVFITSQNHGFAVDPATLPPNVRVTHVSLFDGSLQGFELTDRPAFCFQGHPEASPGPHDIVMLFERFAQMMQHSKQQG